MTDKPGYTVECLIKLDKKAAKRFERYLRDWTRTAKKLIRAGMPREDVGALNERIARTLVNMLNVLEKKRGDK